MTRQKIGTTLRTWRRSACGGPEGEKNQAGGKREDWKSLDYELEKKDWATGNPAI
jgi:hypothetical protein